MVVAKAFEKVLKHGEQRKDAVVASLALATRLGDRSRWSFTRPFVGCPINSELELSGASRPFGYEPGIRRDLTTVWLRQNIKLALGLGLGLYRIVIYIYIYIYIYMHTYMFRKPCALHGPSGWLVRGPIFARTRKVERLLGWNNILETISCNANGFE